MVERGFFLCCEKKHSHPVQSIKCYDTPGVLFGGLMELYTALDFCVLWPQTVCTTRGELAPVGHSLQTDTKLNKADIGFTQLYSFLSV